jgi:hypothetical protein
MSEARKIMEMQILQKFYDNTLYATRNYVKNVIIDYFMLSGMKFYRGMKSFLRKIERNKK